MDIVALFEPAPGQRAKEPGEDTDIGGALQRVLLGNRRDRRGDLAVDQPGDDAETCAMRFKLLVLCAMIACSASAAAQTGEEPRCVRARRCAQPGLRARKRQGLAAGGPALQEQRADGVAPGDRLRLALDGGKTVELVDCPYGAGAYQYLYERYDQAGRFYVDPHARARGLLLHAGDDAHRPAVHRLWRAGLGVRQVEVPDRGLFAAAAARQPRHTGARRTTGSRRKPKSRCPARRKAARRAGITRRGSR